jgi:NAD(P)H-nitrite reductase large subunit
MHLLVKTAEGVRSVAPKRLVVATGAYERGFPVPGWTLPGVMTTGALQTLLRSYRVLPGRRIVIAGNGPLNLQVAIEAARAGAEVLAVVEAAALRPGRTLGAIGAMLSASPAQTLNGAAMRAELALRRIPLITGASPRSIAHESGRLTVELERSSAGGAVTLNTDIVTLGYGFLPSNDVLRLLGCQFETDPRWDWLVSLRDDDGMTTVDGVYAVGDCARFGGAHVAEIEGTLAGIAAARSLGHKVDGSSQSGLRRRLSRHRRFQRALWQLYADDASRLSDRNPSVVVCRCEDLTFGDLTEAVEDGAAGVGTIKRATRAGMGLCQGRYCGSVGRGILRDRRDAAMGEDGYWAPRPPVKPAAIADLIAGLRRD